MKILLAALIALACIQGGCIPFYRSRAPDLPKDSTTQDINARFQGEPPTEGRLYTCGLIEGEFWCLDYFLFQEKMAEKNARNGSVNL